jgi:hypothetical protein
MRKLSIAFFLSALFDLVSATLLDSAVTQIPFRKIDRLDASMERQEP